MSRVRFVPKNQTTIKKKVLSDWFGIQEHNGLKNRIKLQYTARNSCHLDFTNTSAQHANISDVLSRVVIY